MSTDLLKDYFARDLSEAEMLRLSALLDDGEDNSLQFAALAEAAFLALRIPEGQGPYGHGGIGKAVSALRGLGATTKGLILLAAGAAGLSALVWRAHGTATPVRQAQVAPAVSTVLAPTPTYTGLSVEISLPKQGLVTVTVLDGKGTEVALIFAGVLDAGDQKFSWDGLLADGNAAKPGHYRIQVRSGPVVRERDIVIKRQ
jgi:hypothetical protein